MKKVLLATDGSAHAEQAARLLARWPHDEKLALCVVSVLSMPRSYEGKPQTDWVETCLKQERERANESYSRICRLFDAANVSIEQAVIKGHVGETICDLAKTQNFDLVVVGAKGHATVARILLGSTSDFVATHASCSVLVVRPSEPSSSEGRLRIALGYEETRPAQAALDEIANVNWGGNVELHAVTVAHAYGLLDPFTTQHLREGVKHAAQRLRNVTPHVHSHLIESEHLGEGLVQYAEKHHCDVLAVGETPRNVLGRILMGSTSRYILRHAPCSVWIARNKIKEPPTEHDVQSPGVGGTA